MAWAMWLAVPIGTTILAALWSWWRGRRALAAQRLDTAGAMRAHQAYLDALTIPARSSARPVTPPSGHISAG
ncbi:hypothetical protein [Jatrophihabitans sp.]|uniref:hypothetical protein n=1 Tax=Jatrophihabitans sp. TaxID=1932789 RepID=UPI0030C6A934|nr:hypothetical protein [Jatrophihabitans sp.]